MHTNGPKEDPLVDLGYESRDVNYKAVRTSIIGFLVFSFVCAMIGVVIYRNKFLILNVREPDKRAYAKHVPADPNPLLQDNLNSKVDLMNLRQAERARLDTTGYSDDTHQAAHIPIEKAMELLASQSGATDIATPTTTPDNAAPDATTTPAAPSQSMETTPSMTAPSTIAPATEAPATTAPATSAPATAAPTNTAPATAPTAAPKAAPANAPKPTKPTTTAPSNGKPAPTHP